VRRFLAWLAGLAGGAAAYRAFRRRPAPPQPQESDPADELRAKLAEARAADDRAAFEAGETPVDEVADVAARRRAVHEQARSAIDEMSPE